MIARALYWIAALVCAGFFGYAGQSDATNPDIDEILQRTGAQAGRFWEDAPSFNCRESVTQEKIGKNGKIEYQQDTNYDYLAITSMEDEYLTIEELRIPQGSAANRKGKPALLSTNGFPTLMLIFHPLYQPDYRFQLEPGPAEGGLANVHFEHIAGARSTSAIMIRDRIYPLDFQGTAVIEPSTGTVQKISATLVSPRKDINVEKFRIEVSYRLQNFSSDRTVRWLPSRALVELQTINQHWRNIHFYSQYKRFSVQSIERASN